jgi:hypothetical protein
MAARAARADAARHHEVAPAASKEDQMSAYERQLIAKYHQADLLSEARQARLAKAARDARPHTQRVAMASLTGPLQSILTSARAWVSSRSAAAARAAIIQPSPSGRVALRSTHLR